MFLTYHPFRKPARPDCARVPPIDQQLTPRYPYTLKKCKQVCINDRKCKAITWVMWNDVDNCFILTDYNEVESCDKYRHEFGTVCELAANDAGVPCETWAKYCP